MADLKTPHAMIVDLERLVFDASLDTEERTSAMKMLEKWAGDCWIDGYMARHSGERGREDNPFRKPKRS